MLPSLRARQYQTHRQLLTLLTHTSARLRTSLDAIIVPASRPAVNLDHAVTLARAVNCQLVVLCSLRAQAAEVNELLALRNFTRPSLSTCRQVTLFRSSTSSPPSRLAWVFPTATLTLMVT